MVASHIHPKKVEAGGAKMANKPSHIFFHLPPASYSLETIGCVNAHSSRDCGDGFSLFFSPPALYSNAERRYKN